MRNGTIPFTMTNYFPNIYLKKLLALIMLQKFTFPVRIRSFESSNASTSFNVDAATSSNPSSTTNAVFTDPFKVKSPFLARLSQNPQLQESTITLVLEIEKYYEFNK